MFVVDQRNNLPLPRTIIPASSRSEAATKPAKQRATEKERNTRRTARNKQSLVENPGSPHHQGFPVEKPLSMTQVLALGTHERVPSQACNTCIARDLADKCCYRGLNQRCRACQVLQLSGCSYFRPRNPQSDNLSDMYVAGKSSLAHIQAIVARLQVSRQQESVLRDALAREQGIALSANIELFKALRGFAVNSQDREPFSRIVEDEATLQELTTCLSLIDVGFLKDLIGEGYEESSLAGLVSRLSPRILAAFPTIRRHLEDCGYDAVFDDMSDGTATDEETQPNTVIQTKSNVNSVPEKHQPVTTRQRKRKRGADHGSLKNAPLALLGEESIYPPSSTPETPQKRPNKTLLAHGPSEDEVDQLQVISSPQKFPSVVVNRQRSIPSISTLSPSLPLPSPLDQRKGLKRPSFPSQSQSSSKA